MLRLLHLKNKTGHVRNHYSVSTTTNAQTLYASADVRTDQREMDKYTKLNRMFRRKTKKNRKPVVDQKKTSKVFDTDSLCKDLEASKLRAVDVVLSTHLELEAPEAPNFDHIQMNACFLEQQLMAKREYLTKLLAEVDRQIEDMTDSPGAEDRALETD